MTKNIGRKTQRRGAARRPVRPRHQAEGLEQLFAGRAMVALLRAFFLYPSRDFYQRELTAMSGERLFSIQRALIKLKRAGLIEQATRGNRAYYRVNQAHPAFADIKALLLKTIGIGETLRAGLAHLRDKVSVALIYGSVARGDETSVSDVDVMVIGDVSGREVATVLAPIKRSLNREINPTIYHPHELRERLKRRMPFVLEVLRGPKIFLVGDENALKRVISRGPTKAA